MPILVENDSRKHFLVQRTLAWLWMIAVVESFRLLFVRNHLHQELKV